MKAALYISNFSTDINPRARTEGHRHIKQQPPVTLYPTQRHVALYRVDDAMRAFETRRKSRFYEHFVITRFDGLHAAQISEKR